MEPNGVPRVRQAGFKAGKERLVARRARLVHTGREKAWPPVNRVPEENTLTVQKQQNVRPAILENMRHL